MKVKTLEQVILVCAWIATSSMLLCMFLAGAGYHKYATFSITMMPVALFMALVAIVIRRYLLDSGENRKRESDEI